MSGISRLAPRLFAFVWLSNPLSLTHCSSLHPFWRKTLTSAPHISVCYSCLAPAAHQSRQRLCLFPWQQICLYVPCKWQTPCCQRAWIALKLWYAEVLYYQHSPNVSTPVRHIWSIAKQSVGNEGQDAEWTHQLVDNPSKNWWVLGVAWSSVRTWSPMWSTCDQLVPSCSNTGSMVSCHNHILLPPPLFCIAYGHPYATYSNFLYAFYCLVGL